MRLKSIILCSAVAVLCACSKAPTGYTITGTVDGAADGDTVFLFAQVREYYGTYPVDSTYVKSGKFTFTGDIEGADFRLLSVMRNGERFANATMVIEPGEITVNMHAGDETKSEVKGGKNHQLYREFVEHVDAINAKAQPLWQQMQDSTLTAERAEQIKKQLEASANEYNAYTKKFIIDHIPSGVSDMLLGYYSSDMDDADVEEIVAAMEKGGSTLPFFKAVKAERAELAKTGVGAKFTDFSMDGIDGEKLRVADIVAKNELTLIDFWASWCGPCMAEMPNVKAAYDQYHAKGFEVVGVSLDDDDSAWRAAVKQLKLTWPQLCDHKGWNNEAAQIYHVKAIPTNVLIGKDGIIVAKDLRGDELIAKVGELLK